MFGVLQAPRTDMANRTPTDQTRTHVTPERNVPLYITLSLFKEHNMFDSELHLPYTNKIFELLWKPTKSQSGAEPFLSSFRMVVTEI